MKHWIPVSTVAVLAIALLTMRPGYSDDANKAGKKAKPRKSAVTKAAPEKPNTQSTQRKKSRGRLPNYYAKIGISKKQREAIYAVQAKYTPQIKELRKQMAALVAKRNTEVAALLTDSQKEQLVKAREEAKQRAAKRAKTKGR